LGGKHGAAAAIKLKLAHNSCFVMGFETNMHYKHEIPKNTKV
jgi:hypothetical protein